VFSHESSKMKYNFEPQTSTFISSMLYKDNSKCAYSGSVSRYKEAFFHLNSNSKCSVDIDSIWMGLWLIIKFLLIDLSDSLEYFFMCPI